MKQLDVYLPQNMFCRVHRSYIVSLKHISAFDNHRLYIDEKEFPIARHYQKLLHQKLIIIEGKHTTSLPVFISLPLDSKKEDLN